MVTIKFNFICFIMTGFADNLCEGCADERADANMLDSADISNILASSRIVGRHCDDNHQVGTNTYSQYTGFTKTFCNLLDILFDDAMILCRTLQVFVGHFTLNITGEHLILAGHFVWQSRSLPSDIFKICQTCLTRPADFVKPEYSTIDLLLYFPFHKGKTIYC